jgi:TPR repeat protein
MITVSRACLSAVLLILLAMTPAQAGMSPEEVRSFDTNKQKAEKGDPVAQYWVGFFYQHGLGVSKSFVQSVIWYRKAAAQDNSDAQYCLGCYYYSGEEIAKDLPLAFSLFLKAANQGHPSAQFSVGFCYANGEGTPKDDLEAYAYYNLAGTTEEFARKNLALLESKMTREEIVAGQKRTKELQKEIEAKKARK